MREYDTTGYVLTRNALPLRAEVGLAGNIVTLLIALFMDSRASHVLGECGPDVARPHPFCWLYNDFFEYVLVGLPPRARLFTPAQLTWLCGAKELDRPGDRHTTVVECHSDPTLKPQWEVE